MNFSTFISNCTFEGSTLIVPTKDQLSVEPADYKRFKSHIENVGGKWGKNNSFNFPYCIGSIVEKWQRGETPDFRKLQLFPTDINLVGRLFMLAEEANIDWRKNVAGKWLEPSCGTGNIIKQMHTRGAEYIDYCEICDEFEEIALSEIQRLNIAAKKVGTDFLKLDVSHKYDVIVANPPFAADSKHIKKMLEHLNNGGILLGIAGRSFYEKSDSFFKGYSWVAELLETDPKDPETWYFENTSTPITIFAVQKPQ